MYYKNKVAINKTKTRPEAQVVGASALINYCVTQVQDSIPGQRLEKFTGKPYTPKKEMC